MVIRPRPSLLQLFFILRGSIIKRIFPQIVITAGLGGLVVLAHRARPDLLPLVDGGPFALIGIALSIFLSFRNSACYDRWWEARRHWGALIAPTRQLERQTLILGYVDDEVRERLLRFAMAFAQWHCCVRAATTRRFCVVFRHATRQPSPPVAICRCKSLF